MGKARLQVKDKGFKRFIALGKSLAGRPHVKVGFLEETAARRPVDGEASDLTNVELAVILHHGSGERLPPRPFLSNAVSKRRRAWRSLLAKIAAQYMKGGEADLRFGLAVLGARAVEQVRTAMRTIGVPDALRTLAEKRGSRALIDSKQLLQAVTARVDQ